MSIFVQLFFHLAHMREFNSKKNLTAHYHFATLKFFKENNFVFSLTYLFDEVARFLFFVKCSETSGSSFWKKGSPPSSFYTVINCAHPAAQKVARGPEMSLPTLLFLPTKTISKEEKMPISRQMEINAKWF